LIVDPRWTGQLLEIVVMTVAAVLLRGAQVPLSKYSYLTQTGLVALAGCLLAGAPATALAVAGGVLAADWLWQKKMFRAALVNLGREFVAIVGAYGIYAGALRVSDVTAPGLHVDLVPALFFYALAYFVISRLLLYFALIIRGKLDQDEALREHVTRTGEAVVIDDVTRDKRLADAPLVIQSLVMVPLKFGDQVIGTLELEHHKRKAYRPKDVLSINTFANQLATAIHITE